MGNIRQKIYHTLFFQKLSNSIKAKFFMIMGRALICCFCLLAHQCNGRHGMATTDTPDNYHFAQRIREPCGAPTNVLDSIGDESVLNIVDTVSHKINISRIGEVSSLLPSSASTISPV